MSDIIAAHGIIDYLVTVYCDQGSGRRGPHGSGYLHGRTGRSPVAYFAHGDVSIVVRHVDPEDGLNDTRAELAPTAPRWFVIDDTEANEQRNWPAGYRSGKVSSRRELNDADPLSARLIVGGRVVTAPAQLDAMRGGDIPVGSRLRFRHGPGAPVSDEPAAWLPHLGAVALLGCNRCALGLLDVSQTGDDNARIAHLRRVSKHLDTIDGRRTPRAWSTSLDNHQPVPMTTLAPALDEMRRYGLPRVSLGQMLHAHA